MNVIVFVPKPAELQSLNECDEQILLARKSLLSRSCCTKIIEYDCNLQGYEIDVNNDSCIRFVGLRRLANNIHYSKTASDTNDDIEEHDVVGPTEIHFEECSLSLKEMVSFIAIFKTSVKRITITAPAPGNGLCEIVLNAELKNLQHFACEVNTIDFSSIMRNERHEYTACVLDSSTAMLESLAVDLKSDRWVPMATRKQVEIRSKDEYGFSALIETPQTVYCGFDVYIRCSCDPQKLAKTLGIYGQESACTPFDYTIDVSNYRLKERNIDRRKTLVIEVNDDDNADLYPFFDKVCDTIHTKLRQKKSVLVHCAAGISRSTTLVIAYLMKYEHMKLQDAYALVKLKRTCAYPRDTFLKQLAMFASAVDQFRV
ncbi:hypothetical protein B4U80_00010 [Leptotrombidium deliense]|uniref:protein-tyrosine-phosphatase n=1 Tax=Leptotrombidium deliense TaxID=299467 RepID=A0A443SFS6_9ACAR|nr:hypothetical protein B4U80_00010 [Leptotrombidium deliense]